jgi:hypothetical protein
VLNDRFDTIHVLERHAVDGWVVVDDRQHPTVSFDPHRGAPVAVDGTR